MNTENYCFCELAPLYTLNLLSESEQLWFEQQLAENPELSEELVQYENAAATITYSAPVVAMAANLKDRLFSSLELEPLNYNNQTLSEKNILPSMMAVRLQNVQWRPHLVPGSEIAILHTDLRYRQVVGLFRAVPGMQSLLHSHAATEEIYVLEGDLVVGNEVYGAFDYIRSEPGSAHAPYTIGGCMFFFRASMDNEYPDLIRI